MSAVQVTGEINVRLRGGDVNVGISTGPLSNYTDRALLALVLREIAKFIETTEGADDGR